MNVVIDSLSNLTSIFINLILTIPIYRKMEEEIRFILKIVSLECTVYRFY